MAKSSATEKALDRQHRLLDELLTRHRQRVGLVAKSSLCDRIYDHVVDRIRRGEFRAGAKITEATVAKELGVSHVSVREAMERLHSHGWIERIPNRGAFVRVFDLESIRSLFQIRRFLEAESVRELAPRLTEGQLDELRALVDLYEQGAAHRNIELSEEADMHFHRLLVHFVGNSRLDEMFESILLQARGFFFNYTSDLPFYAQELRDLASRTNHRRLLTTLEARDAAAAEAAVVEHIHIGCECALRFCELVRALADESHVSPGSSARSVST